MEVRAAAKARRGGVLGIHDGCLKLAVTAPPEHGKANEALAGLLAETLGIQRSRVCLVAGRTSRRKQFLILGIQAGELQARLSAALSAARRPGG